MIYALSILRSTRLLPLTSHHLYGNDCKVHRGMSSLSSNSGSLTYNYDKVIKILLRGAQFKHVDSKWSELFEVFVRVVQSERGERTVVNVIIEPLDLNQILLPAAALLRQSLSLPFSQRVSTVERFAHQQF